MSVRERSRKGSSPHRSLQSKEMLSPQGRNRTTSNDDWSATIDERDAFIAEESADSRHKIMSGQVFEQSHEGEAAKGHQPERNRAVAVVKAVAACSLYMVIGPSLILTNRYILADLDFRFPMAVASLGLMTTSIAVHLMVSVFKVTKLEHEQLVDRNFYLFNIMPVGVALASTLACGNAVYLYLNVAFIQMLKAFTPVIVLIGLVVSRTEVPRKEKVFAVLGIAITTAANCAGAVEYTSYGLFLMFAAESFEAVRLVLTQKLLKNLKFSVVEGQYWLAPASCFTLLTFSLFSEWGGPDARDKLNIVFENPKIFMASGILGLMVNFSSFFVVKTTSSVTLKILGTVRNALLILFQVVFANEIVTLSQFVAYAFTVVCFGFYSYYDMQKK